MSKFIYIHFVRWWRLKVVILSVWSGQDNIVVCNNSVKPLANAYSHSKWTFDVNFMDHSFWNSAFLSTLMYLALILKSLRLWYSEKHVLICSLSLFPSETLKSVWLIVVYYTNSNFGAQHPPTFAFFFKSEQHSFYTWQSLLYKTGCFEFHIMLLASKKDLLFNKVLCFTCLFLRNECFRVYKYRNFSLLSYDISCISPAIQFTTETYAKDNLRPECHYG